jgi:SAM-dependent methyltransferase
MEWFKRDFDSPEYFEIYADKEVEAELEGPGLAGYLDVPPQSLVLDVPCGWGRLHPYWLRRSWRHVGGDLRALNLARHAAEHPSALVRLDMRRLPFRDSVADAVVCAFTSWGYFSDMGENMQQLREYARVLKPGAPLLLDLTGRTMLQRSMRLIEGVWFDLEGVDCKERVCWARGGKRILTDRIMNSRRFQHDIWIPTDEEVGAALRAAVFGIDRRWGGLSGEPWTEMAERWVYRAVRRGASFQAQT